MIDPISWAFSWPYILAAFAGAYLLGSIPFGLVLTRTAGIGDIRHVGSGNIGATNVLRTGRKGLAALTLLLDAAKGAAAVLIGGLYGPDIMIVAGAGAFIGHVFPVWLRFDGGKGVATALGVLLGLAWPAGLATLAVWLIVLAIFRYSSLSALVASAAAPGFCYWLATPQKAELMIALGALIWLRHAGNIRRLLKGEEPRVGGR
jgi:acyl phosphate:glycerol-3-phosphate acyltransferase